eukprot:TRINITY_DN11085_c0_g2_i1.p3 TRINITY_DN11085_c0_g2~~TRINITY_DN11085_c0_g2_i1.p3  ORF type:complete len:133 (-),score=26.18 TRINITY_DN11085_c0_g2_i1:1031-1429(-)
MKQRKTSSASKLALLDKSSGLAIADKPFIGSWNEAPKHSQDNEYILRGYRVNFNTTKRILKSLFMLHNESMNVWSHLAGMIVFIAFVSYVGFRLSPLFTFKSLSDLREKMSREWGELPNFENATDRYSQFKH